MRNAFGLVALCFCSASIRNGTWRQLELPVHPTAFGCASALAFAPRFCFEAASAR